MAAESKFASIYNKEHVEWKLYQSPHIYSKQYFTNHDFVFTNRF